MESFDKQLLTARKYRAEREPRGKYSRETLSHATGKVDGGRPYVSGGTVEAIEMGRTKRPDDETILRLGEALAVPDEVFPAYALARARRALDEWQVGDQALANLAALAEVAPTIVREQMEQELDALVPRVARPGNAGEAGKHDQP